MATRTVAGREVEVTAEGVVVAMDAVMPEPLKVHYVVVAGRRYPPKQVLEAVTGIDRSDFTTHHARRILQRAGLRVGRIDARPSFTPAPRGPLPHDGREAMILEPYMGQWIAQSGLDVLVSADSPQEVMAWLRLHRQQGTVWRVPLDGEEIEGLHGQ